MSEANEREILSAREDKIHIPKRPCNVLFILYSYIKDNFFYLFLKQQNSAIKVVTVMKDN